MAWGEQAQLVERFHAVGAFLKTACRHWQLGSSYDGWVAAGQRELPRLLPLIIARLRDQMRRRITPQQCGRWEAWAVDGSQITCPRTRENQAAMGDVGKPDGMPLLSLTVMQHLASGLPWDFRVGPGTDSERTHLRSMLDELPRSALLVADAGFIGYDLCREMFARGQHFLLRVGGNVHLFSSLGYDFEIEGQTVYLWPTKSQAEREPPLVLRLIVVRDEHHRPVYLVTSVLEPAALSDAEAAAFYRQRWGIEVGLRSLKQTMEHHTLRSRTPATCYLEMTWAFVGVWLLQLWTASQVEAAGGAAREASTAQARNVVRRVLRRQRPCHRTRRSLARAIAGCRHDNYVRQRPKASRNYPRKKRHEPPGPPHIKPPNATQLQQAQQLTPLILNC